MTRDQASQLLGVDGTGSSEPARRRYEELFNDYQVRLANAPTPALKRKYQSMLAQLDAAVAVLAPAADAAADLPSRTPPSTQGQRDVAKTAEEISPTAAATSSSHPVASRSVLIAIGVAAVMAAFASFIGLKWFAVSAHAAKLETAIAELEGRQKELTAQQSAWRALLVSGPLQVCNRSNGPIKVTAVMAMYLRPSGDRVYVHSGSFGYPEWLVNAGGRTRLEIVRGRADDWDGTASVYAIQVTHEGTEPFIVAGLWSDLRDGCINLSLD